MSQALDILHSKLIASQQADDDAFGAFDAVVAENAGLVKQIADLSAKLAANAAPVNITPTIDVIAALQIYVGNNFSGGDTRAQRVLSELKIIRAAVAALGTTTQTPTLPPAQAFDPLAVTLSPPNRTTITIKAGQSIPNLGAYTNTRFILEPGTYRYSGMMGKGVELVARDMPASAFDRPTVTIDGGGQNALSPTGGNLIAGIRFVNCAEAVHAIGANDWMAQDCMMDWPTTGKFAWVQNCANWTFRRIFCPALTGDQNLARVASSGTSPSRNGRFEYCVALGPHANPVVRLPGVDGIDFLGCYFANEGDDVITVQDGDTYLQGYRAKNVKLQGSTFRGDVQANPGCQNVTGTDVKFLSGGAVVGNETFFQQHPEIPKPENFVIALGAGAVATEAALKLKGLL